jgi:hypothetical protein
MDLRSIHVDRVSLDTPRRGTYQLRYGGEKQVRFQTPVWTVRYTEHRAVQRLAADHRWFDDLVRDMAVRIGATVGLCEDDFQPPRTVPLATDCVYFDREGTFLDESPLHAGCTYTVALLIGLRGVWSSGTPRNTWGVRWEAVQVRVVDTVDVPAPKVYVEGVELKAPMFLDDP